MNTNWLRIKDFGKLTGLSRKALYMYDKHNILNPVFIHPDNDYRYYGQNQLLAAKRIILLKQAGFTLNEIREVMDGKLSDEMLNELLDEKLNQEMNKIKAANQAINQLESLSNQITIPNNEVKTEFLEPVIVYEYSIDVNQNICVALNDLDEMIKELKVSVKDKIIKYKRVDNQIYPVSIALPVVNQKLNHLANTCYFGFNTIQFYCEVNPYQEESVRKINEIMENNELAWSEPFIYERIVTPDDYLYSSKRLSVFIFPSI